MITGGAPARGYNVGAGALCTKPQASGLEGAWSRTGGMGMRRLLGLWTASCERLPSWDTYGRVLRPTEYMVEMYGNVVAGVVLIHRFGRWLQLAGAAAAQLDLS